MKLAEEVAAIQTLRESGQYGILTMTYGKPRTLREKYRAFHYDPPRWYAIYTWVSAVWVYGLAFYGLACLGGWT